MSALVVVTTVGSADDARRIARSLVERGLAACVQIGAIESLYVWDGALQDEAEWRLTVKTTQARYDAVESAIVDLHPYQLPAIHALPIERIHAPYADWVEAQCRATP